MTAVTLDADVYNVWGQCAVANSSWSSNKSKQVNRSLDCVCIVTCMCTRLMNFDYELFAHC